MPIPEEHLAGKAGGKGRTVGEKLAHIHNVRLMWLSAPALMTGIAKIEKETINKKLLAGALAASAKAIENLLVKGFAEGRIKGFKPHPASFLGYLLSHESHHPGTGGAVIKTIRLPG